MRRYRLFCPTLGTGTVVLAPEESRHAIASRRAKPGQEVVLFDGFGCEATGVIARVGRARVWVDVSQTTQRPFELPHRITLAVAMTKSHRQGYLIEKCTELGVAAIWPIIAERSVSKPDVSAVKRWSRRAIEAAKQSGRAWIPAIEPPKTFAESVTAADGFHALTLTEADSSLTPFSAFLAAQPASSSVLVWVGPEGGWSDTEHERARRVGAVLTTLGPTVLRTETAAVAVCAAAAMHGVVSRNTEV